MDSILTIMPVPIHTLLRADPRHLSVPYGTMVIPTRDREMQTTHWEIRHHRYRIRSRWRTCLPLHFDRVILGELRTVEPKLKRNISGPEVHFDNEADVLELEECQWLG
jgi:hypothetical protein